MSTDASNATDNALKAFAGQLDAHGCVVQRIAGFLEEEGVGSYARPLREASRNLDHAFVDLRYNLEGWESAESIPEDHVRALGRLVHAAAVAGDGMLELTASESMRGAATRSMEEIMSDLYADAEIAYKRMLAMRGEDWDADLSARLEEVDLIQYVGGGTS